ncbi:MAG TPA: hypothetical protein VKA81_08640 [Verrucomicrobiae bacterium]|nr:hypothetical protein [Verrucomicrobiae bacterium]
MASFSVALLNWSVAVKFSDPAAIVRGQHIASQTKIKKLRRSIASIT